MTSPVDKAYASPTTVYVEPELRVMWDGSPYAGDGTIDDLTPQQGTDFTVEHGLDDGMPDPVTSTSQSNAGGVLNVPALTGPPGDATPAKAYFSQFNPASPVVDFERDTAPVELDFGVVADDPTGVMDGPQYTRLFTGQMASLRVKGDAATLDALSRTRLEMMRSVIPPMVWGYVEGANATWLLSWLCSMAGGRYVSPPPSNDTRWYSPMHGSICGFFYDFTQNQRQVSVNAFSGLYRFDGLGETKRRPVMTSDGPYLTGMWAGRNNAEANELAITWRPNRLRWADYLTGAAYNSAYDQLSQANNIGRFSCWVRGDAVQHSSINWNMFTGSPNTLCYFVVSNLDVSTNRARVLAGIKSPTRDLFVRFTDDSGNDTTWTSTLVLPTDDDWHFVSWSWDWDAGTAKAYLDGVEQTTSGIVTDDTDLPLTDLEWDSQATKSTENRLYASIPVAEGCLECSAASYTATYRDVLAFTPTAILRALDMELEYIAEPAVREAWGMMVDLATSTLSAYRSDELDRINVLPLGYFGEAAQQVPSEIVDTERNASELDVITDPSKIRNTVTVQFKESKVGTNPTVCLSTSTSEEIPTGSTVRTYALDTPWIEPAYSWEITPLFNLTPSMVSGAVPVPLNQPFFSANTKADGSGTTLGFGVGGVTGYIRAFDMNSVTIEWVNLVGQRMYLANNGDQIPVMSLLGHAIQITDGYETRSDAASKDQRGERNLSVDLPFIQRRRDAGNTAALLTAMLARGRHEVTVTVLGDPRRVPGDLVTIQDAQGTQADGNWRVLTIKHNRSSASYTQDLTLIRTMGGTNWDEAPGWDLGAWGE